MIYKHIKESFMHINLSFKQLLLFVPAFLMLVFVSGCKESSPVKPKTLEVSSKETPSVNTVQSSDAPVDQAINAPELSIFKEALLKGGLKDIFIGTGPFTVFAPTNDAFKKLGDEKVQNLFKPENQDELVHILIFHFVHGKYLANMLKTRSYKTINGKSVDVTVDDAGNIQVNNAKVIKVDLVGPNGVIHHIDTVLIP